MFLHCKRYLKHFSDTSPTQQLLWSMGLAKIQQSISVYSKVSRKVCDPLSIPCGLGVLSWVILSLPGSRVYWEGS